MKFIKIPVTLACVTALAGCTTTGSDVPSVVDMLRDTTGQNGRACIRKHDIRGYGVLENDVVSIDGRRNYYLATTLPGCLDLSTSMGVMFSGNFNEICGRSMDRIHTQSDSCAINQIFEFDDREQAFETYNSLLERREELKQSAQ